MIALLIPRHSLAVLASTRLLLAVLIGETTKFAPGETSLQTDPNWVASVIAGTYVHGGGTIANIRHTQIALHNSGIDISLRTARALVEDIAVRIDTPALVEG
jgi:hypothetical protein